MEPRHHQVRHWDLIWQLHVLDSFTAVLFHTSGSATIQNPNNSENKVVRLAESREALAVARSWWSQSNAGSHLALAARGPARAERTPTRACTRTRSTTASPTQCRSPLILTQVTARTSPPSRVTEHHRGASHSHTPRCGCAWRMHACTPAAATHAAPVGRHRTRTAILP